MINADIKGEKTTIGSTEFRIIDTMSREIGNPISITGLTAGIKENYGSAHYPNIYNSLMSLKNENIIRIEKRGKASIPLLNFANYLLADILTEMELRKKRELLGIHPEAQLLFASIDDSLSNLPFIKSIILLNPTHNMKLNRAELLIILDSDDGKLETTNRLIRDTKKQGYTRIEYLAMTESGLINSLKSPERNPIKEMLSNKIALYLPQKFWAIIRNAYAHGLRIKFETKETSPTKISGSDLAYNLARFGYKELGPEIRQGEDFSIEFITASILLNDDRRRMSSIPIILAKNKANYNLLAFLAQKYGFAERLLGFLITLDKIAPAGDRENAIALLKEAGIHAIKQDESHVRNTMSLYGAMSK